MYTYFYYFILTPSILNLDSNWRVVTEPRVIYIISYGYALRFSETDLDY
jgi:hypothetical protein